VQLRGLAEEAASRWYRAGAGPVRFQPFGQAGQVDLRVEVVHDLRGGGLEQPDGRRGLPVPGRLAQDRGPPGTEVGAQVVPALRGRYERLGDRLGHQRGQLAQPDPFGTADEEHVLVPADHVAFDEQVGGVVEELVAHRTRAGTRRRLGRSGTGFDGEPRGGLAGGRGTPGGCFRRGRRRGRARCLRCGRCGRCGRRGSGWCGHAGPAPYTFLFPMNLSPKTWSPWVWVDATTGGSGSGPFGGGAVWAGGRPGGAG